MDIVSRLKQFINYLNIPVTQFADSCKIPRPTLSQLLNGRNKKVSDELLKKLHAEYPFLNVLWLLYGEGEMIIGEMNYSSSKPQSTIDFNTADQKPDKEKFTSSLEIKYPNEKNASRQNGAIKEDNYSPKFRPVSVSNQESLFRDSDEKENQEKIDANGDLRKKIVNIIVYYNDNSFESFIPDGKGIS